MAEALDDDDDIFVYMGGDQQVPDGVRRARIHKDVKIIRARAFRDRRKLVSVEFHDGVEIIEAEAFYGCLFLRSANKLLGIKIIKRVAFYECRKLMDVEFGDQLETIKEQAFQRCDSLKTIRMPSVRTVGRAAFGSCHDLSDVEFGEALRTLHEAAFTKCRNLKRVVLPLKENLIGNQVFNQCNRLSKVNLVGGIHNTVVSLHMESWRSEMMDEINRINQTLPTVGKRGKTEAIKQWMGSTFRQLNHILLMKEAATLLELALWKANLDNEGGQLEREGVRMTRGRRKRARIESCVTSGASIVIKNVLPFLS